MICGSEGFDDFERFAKARESWLRKRLRLPGGLPSDDTFRRVFTAIDPDKFCECFASFSLDRLGNPLILKPSAHFRAGKQRLEDEWRRAESTPRGVFYVWGHSYEMTREQEWKAFEELLRHYGRRPGVWYASQGDLMVWNLRRSGTTIQTKGNASHLTLRVRCRRLHPWWEPRVPLAIRIPGDVSSATANGAPLSVHSGVVHLPPR